MMDPQELVRLARDAAADEVGARADWKAGAEDALDALRDEWGKAFPALHDRRLDAVAANVRSEPSETWLPALGSEFEHLGLLLYEIDHGDDLLRLFAIEAADGAVFEKAARAQRLKVLHHRQAGHVPGQGAKLLVHAKAIVADAGLQRAFLLAPGGPVAYGHSTAEGGHSRGEGFHAWFDLRTWPPTETPTHLGVSALARTTYGKGAWAALVSSRPDAWALRFTRTPLQGDAGWQALPMPRFLKGAPMIEIGFSDADLLVTDRSRAWVYRDLASLPDGAAAPEPDLVLDAPPQNLRQGKASGVARTQDGRTCVLCAGEFHEWREGRMQATGVQAHGLQSFSCTPTRPSCFAWIGADCECVVELNLATRELRSRALTHLDHTAWLCAAAGGWVVLLRWGDPAHRFDIAQLWHPATGRLLRLRHGALGKAGAIRQWFALPDGRVVVADHERVFMLGDLDALLARLDPTPMP